MSSIRRASSLSCPFLVSTRFSFRYPRHCSSVTYIFCELTFASEEILSSIRLDWDFMTEGRCVPVQVALRLIDSSSLGLANRYQQFRQTNQDLQSVLKSIVNGKLLSGLMTSPSID